MRYRYAIRPLNVPCQGSQHCYAVAAQARGERVRLRNGFYYTRTFAEWQVGRDRFLHEVFRNIVDIVCARHFACGVDQVDIGR